MGDGIGCRQGDGVLECIGGLGAEGELQLPAKHTRPKTGRGRGAEHTQRTAAPAEALAGKLADVGPVRIELVENRTDAKLWNEYVDRYHDLGYRKPFGCTRYYFVVGAPGLLGCVLVAGATRAIKARDEWIGWNKQRRQENLPWVINNTRFLMFPWVEIRHLASHVLGKQARHVGEDWQQRWGCTPLLGH